MRSAVAASTRSLVRIMRLAQPSPTSHGRFCVPQPAGSRPTAGSGSAICACGFGDADVAGERAFEAAAHRVAVDRGDGHEARVHQRLERRAEAGDEVAREHLVAAAKLFRSAPAEKNFSPAPVITAA